MFRQNYFSATPPNILNLQCKDMRLQAKDIHLQSKDLYLQPKDKDFIAAFQNLYCLKLLSGMQCPKRQRSHTDTEKLSPPTDNPATERATQIILWRKETVICIRWLHCHLLTILVFLDLVSILFFPMHYYNPQHSVFLAKDILKRQ